MSALRPSPPAPPPSTTVHALGLLEEARLIRASGEAGETEFRFKHSLIQEAAYATLLRERRVALHREVAQAILALQPEAATGRPAMLAYHYFHGGEDEPGFRYALQAAEGARRNYAYTEALANYDMALEMADRLDYSTFRRHIRTAYLGKGLTLEISGDHDSARQVFEAMRALGVERRDPVMEAEALNRLATSAVVTSADEFNVEAALERAFELARQAGAPLLTARTLWNQGLRERFRDPVRADGFFRQALEITRSPACAALPQSTGVADVEAHVLIDLMVSHMTSGRLQESIRLGEEALAAFRRLDNRPMVADALAGLGLMNHFRGDFDRARALATEASELSTAIDNPWGRTYSGWIALLLHEDCATWETGLRQAEALLQLAQQVPFLAFRANVNGITSNIWRQLGRTDLALEYARRMDRSWNGPPQVGWAAWTRGVTARALLSSGEVEAATTLMGGDHSLAQGVVPTFQEYFYAGPTIAWLDLARGDVEAGLSFSEDLIRRLEDEGILRYLAEMLFWHGQLLAAVGRVSEAEADLRRSLELLGPMGARALLWPAHAALADVLEQSGRPEEAADQRDAARAVVAAIAADLADPQLRASFLARPQVRAVAERTQR